MTRADLDRDPREVAAMFDEVADQYDLLNDVLSVGQDRSWRRAVVKAVAARPGDVVLDLAAGTGASSVPYLKVGARVVPCDFSVGMLKVGVRERPRLPFVAGDAMQLPFADDSFDAVTISFGLRNVHEPAVALAEMARVTRPGGRLVVCEFSRIGWKPLRVAYEQYLERVLSPIASRLSSNPPAYRYLAESIRAWPDQPSLARIVYGAGWRDVQWRNLSGGIVALHRATRPRVSWSTAVPPAYAGS